MAVSTQRYLSLSGAECCVTVATSKQSIDSDSEKVLIIGTDQILHISNMIKETKEAHIVGLFFHGFTSIEMLAELCAQTSVDIKLYKTVIFCLSPSDISSEFDIESSVFLVNKIVKHFNGSNLYVSDYVFSPKLICEGKVNKLIEINQSLKLKMHTLEISGDLLETDDNTDKNLPIPLLTCFLEVDNNQKSQITPNSVASIFKKLFLKVIPSPCIYPPNSVEPVLLFKHFPLDEFPSLSKVRQSALKTEKKVKFARWSKQKKSKDKAGSTPSFVTVSSMITSMESKQESQPRVATPDAKSKNPTSSFHPTASTVVPNLHEFSPPKPCDHGSQLSKIAPKCKSRSGSTWPYNKVFYQVRFNPVYRIQNLIVY